MVWFERVFCFAGEQWRRKHKVEPKRRLFRRSFRLLQLGRNWSLSTYKILYFCYWSFELSWNLCSFMVVGQILASGFCLFQNGVLFLCIKKRAFFLNICSFMAVGKIFASGFTCFKLVLFFIWNIKETVFFFWLKLVFFFMWWDFACW